MGPITSAGGERRVLGVAMVVSLATGVSMLAIKIGAYAVTGSTAILGDAAESIVHVVAVFFAAYSLRLSYKPADERHPYGHAKIAFFSSGFEGAMIVFAAIAIIATATYKWMGGLQLENLGLGTALTALAALINGGLGYYLIRTGRRAGSIILEADGRHVLTDSWTSLGVLVGLGLTHYTQWLPWDPICAILVAVNILVSGVFLMRRSIGGLMDSAELEVDEQLAGILEAETKARGILYHHLRHRNVGNGYWVEVHLLFREETSVASAHRTATEIERSIQRAVRPAAFVTTHLEALEDHRDIHSHGSGTHPQVNGPAL